MSVKLKVMTFNLKISKREDFPKRGEKIVKVIKQEAPDLIGFQEGSVFMVDWLREKLPEYYILGHGRDADYRGEGAHICYRRDRFDLHAFREEWFSLYPQKPGTRMEALDQSDCPRVYCRADLICRENHKPFAFFNVHVDHTGLQNRILECYTLMRDVASSPYPYVMTGDFNSLPHQPQIKMILSTADELGTVDCTQHIVGTAHGFTGDVGTEKLDYVFTNFKTDPTESYAVADDVRDGGYYSDHNAVCAFVRF